MSHDVNHEDTHCPDHTLPYKKLDRISDDAMVTDVLMKMAKQRRESIEMYEDGGRTELAEKEKAELAVIEEFLPQQMSEDETRAAIAMCDCAASRPT